MNTFVRFSSVFSSRCCMWILHQSGFFYSRWAVLFASLRWPARNISNKRNSALRFPSLYFILVFLNESCPMFIIFCFFVFFFLFCFVILLSVHSNCSEIWGLSTPNTIEQWDTSGLYSYPDQTRWLSSPDIVPHSPHRPQVGMKEHKGLSGRIFYMLLNFD